MADPSERAAGDAAGRGDVAADLEPALGRINEVLLSIAAGRFDARAERDYSGDPLDVLAFLVNASAEEVARLVEALRHEREELSRAQQQLVQSAKLAALGQLAGGVAHELNQPLTVIRTLAQLIPEHAEARVADHVADLELIGKAAERMGHIVDSVRTFARQSSFKRRRIEPALPLADALELLGEQIKQHGIDLDLTVAPELPLLLGDAERLEQVFVNLLANARDALDALPADAPRNIRIAVEQDGAHIRYTVEDSGGGILPEHAAQIFEPFFTTKALGRGTGLGLSVSQGIVAEHGGELCCGSAPTGGARFTVRIPIRSDESEA